MAGPLRAPLRAPLAAPLAGRRATASRALAPPLAPPLPQLWRGPPPPAQLAPPPPGAEVAGPRRPAGRPAAAAAGAAVAAAAAAIAVARSSHGPGLAACQEPPAAAPTAALAAPAALAAAEAAAPRLVSALPAGALSGASVRLYQFESCPFCRKVRACLDHLGVTYELVEVNPLSKAETRAVAPDYPKVPILRVATRDGGDLQLRDSKTIVRALLGDGRPSVQALVPAPAATAATGRMWTEEAAAFASGLDEQWVHWTDKVLVQCIVLNVYRTFQESAETFQYLLTHPAFPWLAQRAAALSGTVAMWGVAKSRKRKFDIADERAALYEAVELFAEAVRAGGARFLGGRQPGAADFNVFGVLRSAEGCQTERDVLEHCPGILPWLTAMEEAVGPSRARNPVPRG